MSRLAWLAGGGLIALYAVQVAANSIYEAATQDRVELLQERIVTLSRVDPDHRDIGEMRKLISQAGFSIFSTIISTAIAKRGALARYLNRNPHVVIGLAVDGTSLSESEMTGVLSKINTELAPHQVSVGLAQPAVRLSLPEQATREDVLRGVTTVFDHRPDIYIALTPRDCQFAEARPQRQGPRTNRLYSFGLRKLFVVDGAVANNELRDRLLTALANTLTGKFVERRWSETDYSKSFKDILSRKNLLGRVVREPRKPQPPDAKERRVSTVIGLDSIAPQQARSYIEDINLKFKDFGIRFDIKRLYQHRLEDKWKWPLEIQRMQLASQGELFMLLTSDEWISQKSGHVRGLGSAFFGSIMVLVGTRQETILRLMHEIGHQFRLPHTFQAGAVMYPNEAKIGFDWSPGNRRRLIENRMSATWHSSQTYRDRFDISIRMAPPMLRSAPDGGGRQPEGFAASQEAWIKCR